MRVAVNGVSLFVDVAGPKLRPDGPWLREVPTVVILHTGPGADHTPYKAHIGPVLAERAEVLYLDMRGHGRSEASTPETWRVATWTDDLRALLERLHVEQPILLGAGWGSLVALHYAHLWPDEVSKLVLVNPAARLVLPRMVARFDELAGAAVGDVARTFYDRPDERTVALYMRECFPVIVGGSYVMPALLDPIWNLHLAVEWTREEARTLDLTPELSSITAPSLVVAGTDDPQYPTASIEEVVDALPNVRAHWYPGARHSVFRDAPESMQVVKDFVTP